MNHKNKKNRTATIDNITLVLELIGSLHYFTEKVKRDLSIAITEWSNTSRDYPDFAFSLERYMEIRGLTNKKEAIQDIKKSLKVLALSSIFIEKNHTKSDFSNMNIPIFTTISYRKGIIHCEFSDIFFKLLRDSTSVPFLSEVLLGKQKMNHKKLFEAVRDEDEHEIEMLSDQQVDFNDQLTRLLFQGKDPKKLILDYMARNGLPK